MTLWSIQEFCDYPNNFGMEVAKLVAPPPATPSSSNSNPAGGLSSVSVNDYRDDPLPALAFSIRAQVFQNI